MLIAAGGFLYLTPSSEASVLSCWEQAYNKWMGCDGAYVNTKSTYADGDNYCENNAANTCSATANTYCTNQANSSCTGNPNPQQCFNNAYNSCYLPQYQNCHTSTKVQCLQNLQTAYNNRGNSYQSCLGFEGNYGNCVEELEFKCNRPILSNKVKMLFLVRVELY